MLYRIICVLVLFLCAGEADGGNYLAPRSGLLSFNHERMLTLWEPARRVNVDDAAAGPPFIGAFFSEFEAGFPGDYDLPERRRSALRAYVGRSEAWPEVGRSALEYGLVWAPNGSKISLAGGGGVPPED